MLGRNATQEEIGAAFRKLAKEFHPDKSENDITFKKIEHAYYILKDPERRNQI